MAEILTPDLCVIGAGAGGLAVAEAARAHGATVILVEKGRIGGSALNTGAVPLKALTASGAHAQAMRAAAAFGIAPEEPKVAFRRVHDHIEQVIAAVAPQTAAPRLKALGIEIIGAAARFVSPRAVQAGDTEIRARRFVIATGSRPTVPAIPGLDGVPLFTTDTILDNTRKLTHLVVVGAGAAALELAQAYRRLGSEVTLVGNGGALHGMDPELTTVALKRMVEEGVRLLPAAAVTAIQVRSMGIGVAVRDGDTDLLLDASHILVATDRIPNLEGLDLEAAGIRRNRAASHQLQLTAALRTTNARVYAVGDVAGSQTVASALQQAGRVVRHALLGPAARVETVPSAPRYVAIDPQVAEIGLTEVEARRRYGIGFRVTRRAFADNDAARAERATYGLVKLITHRSGRIIGAGVVGPGAADLVSLFAVAMAANLPASRLADLAVPYPSHASIVAQLGEDLRRTAPANPLLWPLTALNRLLR